MPHPRASAALAQSPFNAGLSYFPDEYSRSGDFSQLGFSLGDVVSGITGVVSGVVSGNPASIASGGGRLLGGLTGNQDAQRAQRAQLIQQAALSGSVLAAQIIIAGPANVAGDEAHYWQAAAQIVQAQRPDVWAEAQTAGPWWPVGQDFAMTQARQQIAAQLSSFGVAAGNAQQAINSTTGASYGSTGTAAGAAAKVGIAALMSNPLLLAAGAALVVFVVSKKR